MGLGSSIGILKRSRHAVDLALVSFFSTPLNHRDQAATVSAVFAPIAARFAYDVTRRRPMHEDVRPLHQHQLGSAASLI
jgi:hypothetical protein